MLAWDFPPRTGGAAAHVDGLTRALGQIGHEVVVLTVGVPGTTSEQSIPVGGDGRANQLGLERLAHQVRHRHRRPAEQAPLIGARQAAESGRGPHQRPRVVPAGIVEIGRRPREERAGDASQPRQRRRERRPGLRVTR